MKQSNCTRIGYRMNLKSDRQIRVISIRVCQPSFDDKRAFRAPNIANGNHGMNSYIINPEQTISFKLNVNI